MRPNDRLELRLAGAGLSIEEASLTITWTGTIVTASFVVRFVASHLARAVAQLRAIAGGFPIGSTAFMIDALDGNTHEACSKSSHRFSRYRKVFLSYANRDRPKVLEDNLLLSRLGLEVFQDILKIDPGERWERELYRNIDQADLFLLYWSRAAAKSEWVCKEAEYALNRQNSSADKRPDLVPALL